MVDYTIKTERYNNDALSMYRIVLSTRNLKSEVICIMDDFAFFGEQQIYDVNN